MCVHFFKCALALKLNQQRLPGHLWLKNLEKHCPCKNRQKRLDSGFSYLAYFPALLGSWSQMEMGWRVNSNETVRDLSSNKQNHRVALLSAVAYLMCLFSFFQTSMFRSSIPLWKRPMWLAMVGGLTWITNYFYTFEVIGLLFLPFRETLGFTELLFSSTNFSNY